MTTSFDILLVGNHLITRGWCYYSVNSCEVLFLKCSCHVPFCNHKCTSVRKKSIIYCSVARAETVAWSSHKEVHKKQCWREKSAVSGTGDRFGYETSTCVSIPFVWRVQWKINLLPRSESFIMNCLRSSQYIIVSFFAFHGGTVVK